MRRFRVNCIQISGKGQLLFNHGEECTDEQLDNTEWLLKDGAISEISEIVDKKAAAKEAATKEAATKEAAAKEAAAKEAAAKEAAAKEAAAKEAAGGDTLELDK